VGLQAGQVIEVTAGDVAQGGWCVARPPEASVVFVRHALPGETVRARVTEVTSRFARADAIEILDPSPDRVEPPCPNARPGRCGGCDWQHATLPAQRRLKAAVVSQQLRRLAKIDPEVTVEPLPGDEDEGENLTSNSKKPGGMSPGLGWRTRVQFAVRDDGLAGLRAHRSHRVVDIGDCPIAHPGIRELGIPRRRWPGTVGVEAVVGGGEPAERAVIVTSAGRRAPTMKDDLPQSPETVLTRAGRRLTPVRGRPYLSHRAGGRAWRVSAGAFWQVHPAAADTLTGAVLAALEPKPGDTALDLYCGAGLFAGALAPAVGPGGAVAGVESDPAAVRDARHNLREWPWVRVHRCDVADVARRGLPVARLAVADPPRTGLAREVIDHLSGAGQTERFAYVSCDPATLARDIGLLLERGWTLEGLRAFDAFPMTHHVECVAVLTRGARNG
jgi:tRNA/tmRNA/rRNA uracil-C5-methylase (TrmA/RlmC/RlmD family)